MPDPARQVNRDAARLAHKGYSNRQALSIIVRCARSARALTRADGFGATPWLDSIEQVARSRLRGSCPADDTHHGGIKGNG